MVSHNNPFFTIELNAFNLNCSNYIPRCSAVAIIQQQGQKREGSNRNFFSLENHLIIVELDCGEIAAGAAP
jgi:hypothetical protein